MSEGIQVVDLYTGKHRTPIKSDLVNVSRVVDFLSDVDICEKTRTGLIPALASANLIYGLGVLESGITFGFGQLVLDNEFARMIKHTLTGIPVSDESLAVDVIKEEGPFRDFLSHDSTFKHMRSQSRPRLVDRRARKDRLSFGETDLYRRPTKHDTSLTPTGRNRSRIMFFQDSDPFF